MEPIRVLYIDHVAHLSGAEQSLFDLVVGLAGGPVEPVVVLPEDGPLATQLRAAGVLVRKVKMSKRLLETSAATLRTRPFVALARLFSFIAVSFRLRHIIREMRPHVIHTNTLKAHLLAIIPAKLSRTPLVWHVRDIMGGGWLRRAFLLCARFPDRIVVISRAVAQSMGRNKTVYRKLRLIPNGIRVDTFDDRDEGIALREEIGAGARDVVVGVVGRIAPWKGQDIVVHAAAMLADRHPKVKFAIVGAPMFGDDHFQHELASLVYQYELDDMVSFTGWRGAQEAMAAIDIVVHSSVEPEPFGRTIVEAMAAGRPVVATAGGAVGEILPPNAGFIIPPARPEILADALETLLADKKLREEMGENGKTAAARYFDVRRTIGAVGTLYSEITRESLKAAAVRKRRGGILARFTGLRIGRRGRGARGRDARGAERVTAMRGRMPQRPPMPRGDRMPPVLRPEAPDAIPAGRPQRRVPASMEDFDRPVRRTARIEEEIDAVAPPRAARGRQGAAARPPAAPGRRPVPAMPERGPVPPQRTVHRPLDYAGGHVIRRPAVLDDPAFVEPLEDDEIVVPVRREVPEHMRDLLPPPPPSTDDEAPEVRAARSARRPVLRFERETTPPAVEELNDELVPETGDEPAADAAEPDRTPEPEKQRRFGRRRGSPRTSGSSALAFDEDDVADDFDAAVVARPEPDPAPAPQPAPQPLSIAASMPQRVRVARKPLYELIKRLMDIAIASVVLLIGAPLWLLTALAIKLDSRGPVLFKGTVWGKDCAPFRYYKFRSMKVEGDDDGHRRFIEQYVTTGSGVVAHDGKEVFKYVGDSRITRVGRIIRKLSIDEVPQLVNVIKGDMSIVGPRPPLEYEYKLYDDFAKQRLAVRPGMTGLQQTYARHSAAFAEKIEMDLAYIRDRSLWLDLTIIAKTIPVAFKGE